MSTSVSWPGGATNATITGYSVPAAGEVNWANLSDFLIALGRSAQGTTFQKFATRVATSSPITFSVNDCIVVSKLTVPAAVSVTFPAGLDKAIYWVVDGTGDAKTNHITITPNGTDTINGGATYVMAENGQAVGFAYNVVTTDWKIFTNTHPSGTTIGGFNSSIAIVSDAGGYLTSSLTTATEIGYVHGVTSSIQTQLNSLIVNPTTTTGDTIYATNTATPATLGRLGIGATSTVYNVVGGIPSWNLLLNANVDPAAAILGTKIVASFGAQDLHNTQNIYTTGTSAIGLTNASLMDFNAGSRLLAYGSGAGAGNRGTWQIIGLDNAGANGLVYASFTAAGVPTFGGLGLGVLHSSAGGVITSSTIVNADVNASAAIAVSKLAALTASRAVATDGSGFLTVSVTTATELGFLTGATSNIQAQLNAAGGNPMTTTGDMIYAGNTATPATEARLGIGSTSQVLNVVGGLPAWNFIVDANVSASAAIAGTKIAASFGAQDIHGTQNIYTTGSAALVITNASAMDFNAGSRLLAFGSGAGAGNRGIWSIIGLDNGGGSGLVYLSFAATGAATLPNLGLGIVHSSAGGLLSSSLIVNADVASGAAIAVNKLAALTASTAVATDGSGFLVSSSTTATELGFVHGVTSSIQTQLNAAGVNPLTTTGDIIYASNTATPATEARLGIGATSTVLNVVGGIPSWNLIVNANVSASAAIVGTKIVSNFGAQDIFGSQNIYTTGTAALAVTNASAMDFNSGSRLLAFGSGVGAGNRGIWSILGLDNGGGSGLTYLSFAATGAATIPNLGLGVVHSSSGGLLSSSTIVNADVDAAAAIAGTKISPVFGTQTAQAANEIVGQGDATGTTTAGTLRGPARTGSNAAGVDTTFDAANGTGTGGSGNLIFRTAPVAGSSSTANTLAAVLTLTPAGATSAAGTIYSSGATSLSLTNAATMDYSAGNTSSRLLAFGSAGGAANRGTWLLQGVDNAGSNGLTYINTNASGVIAVQFPATQVTNAGVNVLDDYEEGTWTPAFSESGNGFTFTTQVGAYTKVGNLITWNAYIVVSGWNIADVANSVTLTGFPFTSANVANQRTGIDCTWFTSANATMVQVGGYILPNSAIGTLTYFAAAAGGASTLTVSQVGNSSSWVFAGSYYAAT